MVIAVEVHSPKGFGRARMRQTPDVSAASLVPFICDAAEQGSEVLTHGWGDYNELASHGYSHERVVSSATGDPAHLSLPGVNRIAALLKRWLLSTHQWPNPEVGNPRQGLFHLMLIVVPEVTTVPGM